MALVAAQLGACASILSGTTQAISIDTSPEIRAECALTNEKGEWTLPQTPGVITVARAYGPLSVTCRTRVGSRGTTSVHSTTNGATWGNAVMVGGLIGAAVDMTSGAAYDYPGHITVPMVLPGDRPG